MKSDDLLVSFIVPVYNVKPYLAACVGSILRQGHKNIECICVDDGSTDGSGELLDELSQKDERVTVIHQKNAGVGAARNVGVGKSRGDYVSFVDSDDLLEPDFLTRGLSAFERYSDLDVWMGQLLWVTPENEVMKGQGVKTSLLNSSNPLHDFLRTKGRVYYYTIYPKLFRGSLVRNPIYRFPVGTCAGEDAAYMAKIYSGARRVVAQDCFVYRYRVLPTGLLHIKAVKLVPDRIASHKDVQTFARETGRLSKLKRQIAFGACGTIKTTLMSPSRETIREHLRVLCLHPDFRNVIVRPIFLYAPFPFCLAGALMIVLPGVVTARMLLCAWRIIHLKGNHA